nr:homoserine dehydrogenase [Maliibacterium massiliense]
MKTVRVGMLGLGNIGAGVVKVLRMNADAIAHRDDVQFEIVKILVRDKSKARAVDVDEALLTEDPAEVLDDPSIGMVAEFMGGVEPAHAYLVRALQHGKTVVTANKNVVATHWPELERVAQAHGAGLYYEASVAGGIPLIKTLLDSMQANRITEVMGIINGTTNYILTRMREEGKDYEEVLADAQALGYAEPDPTYDVEGLDAVYKLSILASLAFHSHIPVKHIFHQGITRITQEDIAYARELGLTLKLLAIGKKRGLEIEVRVHPTFIPDEHPLASVRGAYNAIYLSGDAVGDVMLYGKGAGDLPTASAVISDMVLAAGRSAHQYTTFYNGDEAAPEIVFDDNWECSYFIHAMVKEQPGVLANVAGILGRHGVSLAAVIQKDSHPDEVPIILLTHRTRELAVTNALQEMRAHPDVMRIVNAIRVEGRD